MAVVVVALVSSVSAQLNFSPGWGKRAAAAGGSSSSGVGEAVSALHHNVVSGSGSVVPPGSATPGDACGPMPVSAVMHIYRLIKVRHADTQHRLTEPTSHCTEQFSHIYFLLLNFLHKTQIGQIRIIEKMITFYHRNSTDDKKKKKIEKNTR